MIEFGNETDSREILGFQVFNQYDIFYPLFPHLDRCDAMKAIAFIPM